MSLSTLPGTSGPSDSPESFGLNTLRRRLQRLHDALRDEGLDPTNAVCATSGLLTRDATVLAAASERIRQLANEIGEGAGPSQSLWAVFQEYLSARARHGLGQYLTPPPVAELMREITRGRSIRTIFDPFLGSGLLLEAAGEVHPNAELRGIEINATIAQIARAVARLSDSQVQIKRADAFRLWADGAIESVDAVLTNPPYGATSTSLSRPELIALGVPTSLADMSPLPSELLGLELSISVLKPGGFLAVVLPYSFVSSSRWNAYRAEVLLRIRPIAIVTLPEDAFSPFGGVARACVLLAERLEPSADRDIPYFTPRSVGYDGRGRSTGDSDLLDIIAAAPHQYLRMSEDGALKLWAPNRSLPGAVRLGDIADVFSGRTPSRDSYEENGPLVLKVGDLSSSFVDWRPRARNRTSRKFLARSGKQELRVGDICLTAAAHKPRYIGLKVNVLDTVPAGGAVASSEVLIVRLHTGTEICPVHLLAYLRSSDGYSALQELVRGSTAHLYAADVAEIRLPELHQLAEAGAQIEAFDQAAAAYRRFQKFEDEWIATCASR